MKDYLYFIASDEMEGRNTPSRGLDLTAKFIAMNLSRWGLKPGGDDGTYFQKFALRRDTADAEKSWIEINGQKFAYGEDFINVSGTKTGEISAPIVYVGNGWMIKSKNLNPYVGIDVKEKLSPSMAKASRHLKTLFPCRRESLIRIWKVNCSEQIGRDPPLMPHETVLSEYLLCHQSLRERIGGKFDKGLIAIDFPLKNSRSPHLQLSLPHRFLRQKSLLMRCLAANRTIL
jgi:hypothetical protein